MSDTPEPEQPETDEPAPESRAASESDEEKQARIVAERAAKTAKMREYRERKRLEKKIRQEANEAAGILTEFTDGISTKNPWNKSEARLLRENRLVSSLIRSDRRVRQILRGIPFGENHVPNEESKNLVYECAGLGMEHVAIAAKLDLPVSTLREMYANELHIAPSEYNLDMAKTIHAIGSDPTHPQALSAAKFWLERIAGWVQKTETTTKHEAIDNPVPLIDSSGLDPEERQQLRTLMEKMAQVRRDESILPDDTHENP